MHLSHFMPFLTPRGVRKRHLGGRFQKFPRSLSMYLVSHIKLICFILTISLLVYALTVNGKQGKCPSISVFAAPKSFTKGFESPEWRALSSWLKLKCSPIVILLGNDETYTLAEQHYPNRVFVEKKLDYNFLGMPTMSSILARGRLLILAYAPIINPYPYKEMQPKLRTRIL